MVEPSMIETTRVASENDSTQWFTWTAENFDEAKIVESLKKNRKQIGLGMIFDHVVPGQEATWSLLGCSVGNKFLFSCDSLRDIHGFFLRWNTDYIVLGADTDLQPNARALVSHVLDEEELQEIEQLRSERKTSIAVNNTTKDWRIRRLYMHTVEANQGV